VSSTYGSVDVLGIERMVLRGAHLHGNDNSLTVTVLRKLGHVCSGVVRSRGHPGRRCWTAITNSVSGQSV